MYLQMLGFLHTVVFIRYQHVCLMYLVNMFKVECDINNNYMVCFRTNNLGTLSRVIKVYQEMYKNSDVYPCRAMYTHV